MRKSEKNGKEPREQMREGLIGSGKELRFYSDGIGKP